MSEVGGETAPNRIGPGALQLPVGLCDGVLELLNATFLCAQPGNKVFDFQTFGNSKLKCKVVNFGAVLLRQFICPLKEGRLQATSGTEYG